ncbi:MAG: PhnD/SsuA/transferrin family substrate-binding protein [Pirellulaceae bacterium]|nr:PhnD/SsuA/transferrin family substrate-binding protein [Pirellulaceae bacterium]
MNAGIRTLAVLCFALSLSSEGLADEPARKAGSAPTTRIGAVAYSPAAVTIFQGLTGYLNKNGLPADYVLYSNYDALVAALDRGEVDIAWNTPLAHAQFHVKNQCSSQTLAMRDVDVGVRSILVARAGSEIKSPADLSGKQLVLGSSQAAEATVLPLHFLKKEGVDLSQVKFVSLDAEVDGQGNPCASPQHVLQALRDGRGDAGIITTELWNRVKDDRSASGRLVLVWTSPPFSHCVFTAAAKFDKQRAARFTQLMQEMDPDQRATKDVMRLEGTKKWLKSSPDGFKDLVEALQGK